MIRPRSPDGDLLETFLENGRSGRLCPCRFFLHPFPIPVVRHQPRWIACYFSCFIRQNRHPGNVSIPSGTVLQ